MYLITITAGTGFDKDGKPLDNVNHRLDLLRSYMARHFGGYTEYNGRGGWVNQGKCVSESSVSWDIMTDNAADNEVESDARLIAEYARKALKQAAVMFTVRPVIGGFVS